MIIWEFFDERARRLGILDTKLAQAAAICVALVSVKLFPQILELDVWWFVLLGAVFAIKPLITFYGRSD
jgi:hypothetical protein